MNKHAKFLNGVAEEIPYGHARRVMQAADEIDRLEAENLQLSELLKAAGIDAKEIKAENAALKVERDALAAECEAWSAMAVALANKHPVDSQTFDYMDELRGTDWGKALARRDDRVKAEALEVFERNTERCGAVPYSELKRRLQMGALKYRKQAEGHEL